jgi:hypothetical protein
MNQMILQINKTKSTFRNSEKEIILIWQYIIQIKSDSHGENFFKSFEQLLIFS